MRVAIKLVAMLLFSFGLCGNNAFAAEILGEWKTIDDESGKAKSIVVLFERDGKVYGKVKDLLLKPDDTVCKKCKGDLKDKPFVGMEIVQGLKANKKGEYQGGKILDPIKGKFYTCKLWLESNDTLKVRGYIGMFYRTQTWYRVK